MIRDFVRLHRYVDSQTLFYPTASQLLAIVRDRCPPDRIVVIVAGNSVFNGYGQPPEGIWSAALQRQLGEPYCVVNLAAAFSLIPDIGATVLNALSARHPRVLLVANGLPAACGPAGGSPMYRYLFWDAYWKGLLSQPEEARRSVEAVARALGGDLDAELRVRMALDALLYFDDLWTFVGYRWVFTAWTELTRDDFLRARVRYPDPVPEIPPLTERFRPGPEMPAEAAKYSAALFVPDDRGGWVEQPEAWAPFERDVRAALPGALRAHTLIVVTALNPWYVDQLPAAERTRHALAYAATVRRWQEGGYGAMEVGGFVAEDFLDLMHLTIGGGETLARQVAPRVRGLAATLWGAPP
jgi:hypothetical protein